MFVTNDYDAQGKLVGEHQEIRDANNVVDFIYTATHTYNTQGELTSAAFNYDLNGDGTNDIQISQNAGAPVTSSAAAHRFLYAPRPRHEIARASELLQAQLLQDININPVQPSLVETDLNITTSGGPARPGFNEFTPLFERNQVQLNTSGLVGNHGTHADESVVSGIYDKVSVSAGQLFSSTDGFRRNADSEAQLYNFFAQAAVTPSLTLQAEVRQLSNEQGDLRSRLSTEHYTDRRRRVYQDTGRFGLRFPPAPHSHFITSLIYANRDANIKESSGDFTFFGTTKEDGIQAEAQYIFNGDIIDVIPGVDVYKFDAHSIVKESSRQVGRRHAHPQGGNIVPDSF